MNVVLVTGGFDPLHSGHIAYFKAAKALGEHLIVGVNSDAWLTRKKGRPFMNVSERAEIIRNISCVDYVVEFSDDYDADGSATRFIQDMCWQYEDDEVIFANGGDRTTDNIPEMNILAENLSFAFGIGGEDKKNSSSWILTEWKAPKTDRIWGYYRVLHESGKEVKVKELTVEPGQKLSMQRHEHRSEHWFVDTGTATVYTINSSSDYEEYGVYTKHQSLHIPQGMWHQLANETTEPLKLVEIQYGTNCVEEDIERR